MQIKDVKLLFESQIPGLLYAQLKARHVSVAKLQEMYKDPKFKMTFLEVMKTSDLNFKEVVEDMKKLANSMEIQSDLVSKACNTKINFKNPTHANLVKESDRSVSSDYNKELGNIKSYIDKANEVIDRRLKDIKLKWKDKKVDDFENKIEKINKSINKLSDCCSLIQTKMKSQNQAR